MKGELAAEGDRKEEDESGEKRIGKGQKKSGKDRRGRN